MKSVAIFGASRAGKTTLTRMLIDAHPGYQVISGDHIREAFRNTIPILDIRAGGRGIEKIFPRFLADLFTKSINWRSNYGVGGYIVESCDIKPTQAKELFAGNNVEILFIGCADVSAEDWLGYIRSNDDESDWTKGCSDEFMLEHCRKCIEYSKRLRHECMELGLQYVDTSHNRRQILNDVVCSLDLGDS